MVARSWLVLVVLAALASMGAQHRTRNFIVEASNQQIAERLGQWAEYYRKQKAVQWLGREMPDWPQPCPLHIKVSYNGSGGATSFVFDLGRILSMQMEIEGTLERLTYSVLPHEVTHTVLAHHFRQPVPRWADEGGSVLSEDEPERKRHDQLVRHILNTPGRAIPLKRLFSLTQYPRDVMVLYAEGYSVTEFLVSKSSRGDFLNFVADGMRNGWDQAVRSHYKYSGVDELEQAWIESLREARPAVGDSIAKNDQPKRTNQLTSANQVVERKTLPPAMPVLGAPRPVVRGQESSESDEPNNPDSNQHPPAPTPPATGPSAKLLAPRTHQPRQEGWDTRRERQE